MRIWKSPLTGYLIIFYTLIASSASAETCLAPPRPFAPNDPALAREFRDLIKEDFENYLSDITLYFRCLDDERARAFAESAEVAQEYGRFINRPASKRRVSLMLRLRCYKNQTLRVFQFSASSVGTGRWC